jgi:hypothetical protein
MEGNKTLQINTGEIKLDILDDSGECRGVFKFNPTDVESAKHVLELQSSFAEKQKEFEQRAKTVETPEETVNLLCALVEYFNSSIDSCFGENSSKVLFGDAKSLSMYEDFFNGITPYYEQASKARVAKYKKKSGK